MTVQVLLSCMHQKDCSIIERSNIQSDVIVINQCDKEQKFEYTFFNKKNEECKALIICTRERGLSKSRNMALSLATDDICIIADDDEIFNDNYVEEVCSAYMKYPEFSLIFFEIGNRLNEKKGYERDIELTKLQTLPVCSVQTTFQRKFVHEKKIIFNTDFGAGISLAGGEEHLFIFECYKKGLRGRNNPYEMAKLNPNATSTWRLGYSRAFMEDEGKVLAALFGKFIASAVAFRYVWRKRKWISQNDSIGQGIKALFKGIITYK